MSCYDEYYKNINYFGLMTSILSSLSETSSQHIFCGSKCQFIYNSSNWNSYFTKTKTTIKPNKSISSYKW